MEIYEHNSVHLEQGEYMPPKRSGAVIAALALSVAAVILAVISLVLCVALRTKPADSSDGYVEAYTKARACSVQVYGEDRVGSGVIYKISGGKTYVITNHHVVRDFGAAQVRIEEYGARISGEVLGYDEYHDIALIELDGYFGGEAAVAGGKPHNADKVIAVGNNLGSGIAVFDGVVSRTSRMLSVSSENKCVPVYAVTCPVNAGMSGGGLFDSRGEIVGINTYQTGTAAENGTDRVVDGVSYSVPFAIADKIARQALAERNHGQISKLYVSGTAYNDSDKTVDIIFDALSFGARFSDKALKINSISYDTANPPVEMIGGAPEVGDTVLKIGSLDITAETDYADIFAECFDYLHDPSFESTPIKVTLERGGKQLTVSYSFKQLKNY